MQRKTLSVVKTSTSGDFAAHTGGGGESAAAVRGGDSAAASDRRLGSKANESTYKTIINQIPPHRVYVEPFLGWGAVLLNKAPAAYSVGVDLDRERVADVDRAIVTAKSPLLVISESTADVVSRATSLAAAPPAEVVARVSALSPLRARGLERAFFLARVVTLFVRLLWATRLRCWLTFPGAVTNLFTAIRLICRRRALVGIVINLN